MPMLKLTLAVATLGAAIRQARRSSQVECVRVFTIVLDCPCGLDEAFTFRQSIVPVARQTAKPFLAQPGAHHKVENMERPALAFLPISVRYR
jgi:hypothetical protein